MKKRFSTLTVVIIGFLMMAVGVGASSYYHWAGSQDFDNSMNTMDKIQYGIELLMGDLETEKADHENTKTELENLRTQLGLEDGEDSKEALKSLIDERDGLITERDNLQTNIETIAREASRHVVELNNTNGTGPKYQYLLDNINPALESLYNMGNIEAYAELAENPGNGPKDNQLQQAIKDMKDIKDKSESAFGAFDEETRNRIEEAHEYEEYVPEEEEATDTD